MKSVAAEVMAVILGSHPTGVRGLKSNQENVRKETGRVAPHWGAWIEIFVWVMIRDCAWSRTPLGCVD